MKTIYLTLSVIGFIVPNIFVFKESIETGNVLLWLHPQATMNGMFGSTISTAFVADLLLAVFVFFVWTYREAKKLQIKNVWMIWIVTLLFGLGGSFPLFLYLREKKKG